MSKKQVRNVNTIDNNIFLRAEGIEDVMHGWWGMPEYKHNEYCHAKLEIVFESEDDIKHFIEATGLSVKEASTCFWYPEFAYEHDHTYRWMNDEN